MGQCFDLTNIPIIFNTLIAPPFLFLVSLNALLYERAST
jgi:hypothetical protein